MSPHPFDDQIAKTSANVSSALTSLSETIEHQLNAVADMVGKLAGRTPEEVARQKPDFDALMNEFRQEAEAIRHSLSEPNGSRTDAFDLQTAAQSAVQTALANTVTAQNEIYKIAQACLADAAKRQL